MLDRFFVVLLAIGALAVPAATPAAPPGPPIPESITLPTKIVKGDSAVGTICLDRVAEEPTEIFMSSDNEFLVTVDPSVVTIPVGEQCASFTVQSFDRFETTESVVIDGTANGASAQTVLFVIPQAGVDIVRITKAEVDKNFTRITIVATSDEPGAVLTAFAANNVELGVLEQKGDRYVGRFDLTEPTNVVEVHSSLGGCAERAVPFGNTSRIC